MHQQQRRGPGQAGLQDRPAEVTLPCCRSAPGSRVRPPRLALPAPKERSQRPMRGRGKAWPSAGPSARGSRLLLAHSHFPALKPRPVATRVSSTDHTFLAEEGEEGLVLLRGEQQGPHVGDPPRRRLLLLAGAHGFAGGAGSPGPCPPESGRALVPPLGDRGGRRGVRGAASRNSAGAGRRRRPRQGGAGGGPR